MEDTDPRTLSNLWPVPFFGTRVSALAPRVVDWLSREEQADFQTPLTINSMITPAHAASVVEYLSQKGFVVTGKGIPFPGQISRVHIDAYGESAAEVEQTLKAYASRCALAAQAPGYAVSYGRCVIERNLEEKWGETYSWRGRLVLHPALDEDGSHEDEEGE